MSDILEDLWDLHRQATTENSHYYVAGCCNRAIAEIGRLRSDKAMLIELALDAYISPGARQWVAKAMRDGGLPPTQEAIEWAQRVASRLNQSTRQEAKS